MRVPRVSLQEAQVDIRILPFVLSDPARSDLDDDGILRRTILQVMSVLETRLESATFAASEDFFTGVGHEHHLAFEDIDKLIFRGMPVALTRPTAGRQAQ